MMAIENKLKEVKEKKSNSIFLAQTAMDQLKLDGKYVAYSTEEKTMYVFNGKHYEVWAQLDFDVFMHDFMISYEIPETWKSNRLQEIKRAMDSSAECPRITMDDYPDLLNLNNGILNLKTLTIAPHSHKYYFSHCLPINFDPSAAIPKHFISFLEDLFRDKDGSSDKETAEVLIMIGGYLLETKARMNKMFMFLGEGSNGKSVLLDIYRMFFAPKNVSFLPLEALCSSGFERTKLVGSRINITTEAKSTGVDAEELKKIISGEGITINPKFKEPFSYHPQAKLFLASNTSPYFNDTSHGIMRRLYTISFKNRFATEEEYALSENPKEERLFHIKNYDEMMAEFQSEISGILNLFIAGLKKLQKIGYVLPSTKNTQEIKQEYQDSHDTVGSWLRDNYEADRSEFPDYVKATDVLAKYREWYLENVSARALNFSSASMGLKIRDVFRVESKQIYKKNGQYRGSPIKQRHEPDPIPTILRDVSDDDATDSTQGGALESGILPSF